MVHIKFGRTPMTEVGWATIGGIVSMVIAQLLRWALSRTTNRQSHELTELDSAWDEIKELKVELKQVKADLDVERTARIALELENLSLKKRIIILEGVSTSK